MDSTSTKAAPKFQALTMERRGAVTVVTITRPSVLNALDSRTLDELRSAVDVIRGDDAVRAVVVTGAGDKAFVAGADIREVAALGPVAGQEYTRAGQIVFAEIENLGKPVIAAINGYALGGGCELALACTLRLAADTAKIGLPEIKLGIFPGYGGMQRLARLVGRGRALEMIHTGDHISAQAALAIGLVNRVFPRDRLMPEAMSLAQRLASQPPVAMRYIIDLAIHGADISAAGAADLESALFGLVAATGDRRARTRRVLDKI